MLRPLLALLLVLALPASDAVFQWRLEIAPPPPAEPATPDGKKPKERKPFDVFLWIPPAATQVRGVLVAGKTLAERDLSRDPAVRAACVELGLAIIYAQTGLSGLDVDLVLNRFAELSGYGELPRAPLFFVGHSAGGPQARAKATTYANRCFGLMQYRGGGPYGGTDPVPAGVPCLMMVGQFDEFGGTMRDASGREHAWEGAVEGLLAHRAANAANLCSLVVEPGAGHFAWSERNAAYFALFLKKAAQARIPAAWPIEGKDPVPCLAVDPSAGVITGGDLRRTAEPQAPGGAAGFWHFDQELALASNAYHTGLSGRQDQFLAWKDGHWIDGGCRYFFNGLAYISADTFRVTPMAATTFPASAVPAPQWAQAGQPVTAGSAPILVRAIDGPMVAVGPDLIRFHCDALSPASGKFGGTFLAYRTDDGTHRHTELVGMPPRGYGGLNKGAEQTITLTDLPRLSSASTSVALDTSSSAKLAVACYVAWGPAHIQDGKLVVSEVPARAKKPIPVRVVAWQFGSAVAPLVKPAAPVMKDTVIE